MTFKLKKLYNYAHRQSVVIDGRWATKIQVIPVQLLSMTSIWATVRRKGAMPFVVGIKELTEIEKLPEGETKHAS